MERPPVAPGRDDALSLVLEATRDRVLTLGVKRATGSHSFPRKLDAPNERPM